MITQNFLDFVNLVMKMTINGSLRYYTIWSVIIQFLYYIGILKDFQESVFYIVLIVAVLGFIMVYIHPRYVMIPYLNKKISGRLYKIFDLIFHQLPLLIFVYLYDTKKKKDNLILLLVSVLAYIILFNPLKVYNIECKKNPPEKRCFLGNILIGCLVIILMCVIINL